MNEAQPLLGKMCQVLPCLCTLLTSVVAAIVPSCLCAFYLNLCISVFLCSDVNPSMLMSDVFKKFGLDANTADFTGHAIALYRDDQ